MRQAGTTPPVSEENQTATMAKVSGRKRIKLLGLTQQVAAAG
jgi:hypothetical protein